MIVKIGEQFFDSFEEPILLILNEEEKELISNMGDQKKYCSFPPNSDVDEIRKWMQVPKELLDAVEYLG